MAWTPPIGAESLGAASGVLGLTPPFRLRVAHFCHPQIHSVRF